MAVQLRNQLSTALELERPLPATLIFDYPTIDAIALYLNEHLTSPEQYAKASAPPKDTEATRPVPLVSETIAAMSDHDVELLLLNRLERR